MITIPMLDWVAKLGANRSKLASFSQAKYGTQTGSDSQWFPDAGNGILASTGQNVTGNDPNDANVPSNSALQKQWVQEMAGKWGLATTAAPRYYLLDNESSIWFSTHRDVHPTGATMDEILARIKDYGSQIRSADPNAVIVGPEEWGWSGYFYSGYDQQFGSLNNWSSFPDRANHGGADYLPWLLGQLKADGRHLLDVFSVHYYPQGGEFGNDVSTNTQLLRNQSTRSLWDPNYVDQSWINDKVMLIPRLRNWVNTYYVAGTPIGITEYNWGAEPYINGATAQADILGIFGREGVDLATRWTTPDASTVTYKAIQMYRNYDGSKSTFGDVSVSAGGPNPDNVAVFAAQRTSDNALTVMVINKYLSGNTPVSISLSNFVNNGTAQVYQLTSSNAITRLTDLAFSGSTVPFTAPAQSITLLVLPAGVTKPLVYTISGQVTLSGAGQNGVTMTLSGSQSASVVTSGSGNYSFASLTAAGNYTVTPSLSGYTFTPPSQTFSNLGANQTANFTATAVTGGNTNLALGKVATQSSTLGGFGASTAASSAVDGNTDGNFAHGSVSHTDVAANSWWQVDLGASATIGSVVIWNRMDCCSNRLSDYWVFVSNTAFAAGDTPATLQGRAGTWSSHQTSYPNPSTTIAVNAAGRYVRVQLSGTNYLSLAEVQVFGSGSGGPTTYGISGQVTLSGAGLNGVTLSLSGSQSESTSSTGTGNYSFSSLPAAGSYTVTPSLSGYTFTPPSQTFNALSANQTANFTATAVTGGSTDLALGKAATQSSTLGGYGPSTAASSAVDGNTDGNFAHGSVSHTDIAANSWWQVDLGAAATIGSIAVWNRTDCCSDRLSDYWVFVSNTPFAAADTPATLQGRAGTWSSHQTSYPNPSTTIAVNSSGRYVRVQLSGTNYLSLAEVQVFGSGPGGPTTYGVSGQVTLSSAGLNGVTMTLSGSQTGSIVSSGSGNYGFSGLAAAGSYTVTPSLSGYSFTPPSQTFNNLSANQTANFTATAVTGTTNLALGKPATQSSTLAGYGPSTAASSAVDGNTDGNFGHGSVSHTDIVGDSWWQVDLGANATINSIAIWNRTDCCSDRLSDYWVFVSNTPFLAGDTPATLQGRAGTWSSHQTSFPNPSSTIAVNAQGRYVRVQLSSVNYLSLAEVQVFGQ